MCGIVGIVSKKPIELAFLKREIKKMNDKIIHRGPDDEGYYFGENFGLGHRRLSIVDLSEAGHQPMQYKGRNGEYIIIYNGEIYNYIELREELKKDGYRFNSDTDTEVILVSYDKWGADCLNKFNGMWAFVIYDKRNNKFFISRDRFGIKPLYYYLDNDSFIFASEIKSIITYPKVKTAPNKRYLDEYLKEGAKEYIKETAFENIFRFMQASYFEGSIEDIFSNFTEKKFWELKVNTSNERFEENKAKIYTKRYYELLKDAVRIRLRADVKVASALSGGLDSSSIVYLINEILREQGKEYLQETFSSVYTSPETKYCDESFFINRLAKTLGVKSNQIEPRVEDIPDELEKMYYIFDNPKDGTGMSGWHVYKLVHKNRIKVLLNGQGADEQLAGYLIYIIAYLSDLPLIELLKEGYRFLKINPHSRKNVIKGIIINLFSKIFGKKITKRFIKTFFNIDFEFNLNLKLAKDTMEGLVNLLHYTDRESMAFSVENRVPFMDYRLVEFLFSVPACYKVHNGWTKYLARLAFDGKLPDEITWRKDKMGWPVPEKYWLTEKLEHWVKNYISFSKKENLKILMRKLNLALWYKIFWSKK